MPAGVSTVQTTAAVETAAPQNMAFMRPRRALRNGPISMDPRNEPTIRSEVQSDLKRTKNGGCEPRSSAKHDAKKKFGAEFEHGVEEDEDDEGSDASSGFGISAVAEDDDGGEIATTPSADAAGTDTNSLD